MARSFKVGVLERVLEANVHAAVRLTAGGRVTRFNDAAAMRYPWLVARKAIAAIAPEPVRSNLAGALASAGDEVVLTRGLGCVMRLSARERLWIGGAPHAAVFDAMDTSLLVWEYDHEPLQSPLDLRLAAANPASERNGPRWPMRWRIGQHRGEMDRHSDLDELLFRVARTGRPARLARDLDNARGVFQAVAFPMPGRRIAVAFTDITEMRRSERTYRAMFEASHDAIVLIDPEGETVVEANPAALEIYGRTADEMAGMSMTELSRWRIPGIVERTLHEGFVRMDTRHLRSDGTEIDFDVHAVRIESRGRPAVLNIMRDVTDSATARSALLQSEEKYRTLVANVPVVIWTAGADGLSTFMSPGVETVTGYTFAEIHAARPESLWADRVHPDDRDRVAQAYRALFENGTRFDAEYRFLRKDGTWAWFTDQATHTYIKSGWVLTDGVTQDITDRKRGELQQLALAGFGRRALAASDDEALLADACGTTAAVLEVPMASVLLYGEDEDAFRVAAAHGLSVVESFRVPNEPDRLAAQTFASNVPMTYSSLPHEARFHSTDLLALGTKAGVVAPIAGHGILHAHTNEPRVFSEREMAFVQSMANIVAEAIRRGGAEREVERQTMQLMRAQELAHIGSMEIDLDSQKIEWSDELYRIAGLEPQSRPITIELLTALAPPLFDADYAAMLKRLQPGDMLDLERSARRVDGTPITVRNSWRIILDPRSGRRRMIATVQDITEQSALLEQIHDAAEEWRETFDSLRAPLVILTSERRILRMNGAALAMSRFERFRDAIHEPVAAAGDSRLWAEMDALAQTWDGEKTTRQVEAEGRQWELLASSSRRGQTIIIASEVSELVRTQETLRRTERMSEMGALVAGVAHEVRNPLFGISATLDAFEQKFGSQPYQAYIGALREQVERMNELMHELLDYGRPLESARAAEPIGPLLEAAIAATATLAAAAGVSVRASQGVDGVRVLMDRRRLLQVFENLVRNAVQHTERGGAVDVSVATDGASRVTVTVEDRGPGFRAGDLPRVFDPFFTKRRGGTGLGLSLVRRIVDDHDGAVAAANREGGGASLIVTLPLAEVPA